MNRPPPPPSKGQAKRGPPPPNKIKKIIPKIQSTDLPDVPLQQYAQKPIEVIEPTEEIPTDEPKENTPQQKQQVPKDQPIQSQQKSEPRQSNEISHQINDNMETDRLQKGNRYQEPEKVPRTVPSRPIVPRMKQTTKGPGIPKKVPVPPRIDRSQNREENNKQEEKQEKPEKIGTQEKPYQKLVQGQLLDNQQGNLGISQQNSNDKNEEENEKIEQNSAPPTKVSSKIPKKPDLIKKRPPGATKPNQNFEQREQKSVEPISKDQSNSYIQNSQEEKSKTQQKTDALAEALRQTPKREPIEPQKPIHNNQKSKNEKQRSSMYQQLHSKILNMSANRSKLLDESSQQQQQQGEHEQKKLDMHQYSQLERVQEKSHQSSYEHIRNEKKEDNSDWQDKEETNIQHQYISRQNNNNFQQDNEVFCTSTPIKQIQEEIGPQIKQNEPPQQPIKQNEEQKTVEYTTQPIKSKKKIIPPPRSTVKKSGLPLPNKPKLTNKPPIPKIKSEQNQPQVTQPYNAVESNQNVRDIPDVEQAVQAQQLEEAPKENNKQTNQQSKIEQEQSRNVVQQQITIQPQSSPVAQPSKQRKIPNQQSLEYLRASQAEFNQLLNQFKINKHEYMQNTQKLQEESLVYSQLEKQKVRKIQDLLGRLKLYDKQALQIIGNYSE